MSTTAERRPDNVRNDDELVILSRAGDTEAYAELWARHSKAAYSVARAFTTMDSDDVVSEAFLRVLRTIKNGGGPTSGFRPYIVSAVRNVARRMSETPNDFSVEDFDYWLDPSSRSGEDAAIENLNRSSTMSAFRALPSRWQEVLWYSEVDGLKPREMAVILGIPANAVSALVIRARTGLRDAWVTAQLQSATSKDCASAIQAMGPYTRGALSTKKRKTLMAHLATCATCPQALEEAEHVSRLTLVLLPLTAGAVGAAGYAASAAASSTTVTSVAAVDPVRQVRATRPRTRSVRRSGVAASVAVVGAVAVFAAVSVLTTAQGVSTTSQGGSVGVSAAETPAPVAIESGSKPAPEKSSAPAGEAPAGLPDSGIAPSGPVANTAEPAPASPSPVPVPSFTVTQVTTALYPRLHGTGAAAFATIDILDEASTAIATTTADAAGVWSVQTDTGDAGTHSVTVRQNDHGRVSLISAATSYTISPPPQMGSPSDGSTVSGTRFGFTFTARPGSTLLRHVVGYGPEQMIQATTDGVWNEYFSVPPGEYQITLRYVDADSGQVGPASTITFHAK